MNSDLIKRLDDLHKAATPGKLETAEFKEVPDWFSCPHCNGEGEVDAVQYVNYDGVAANVLFSGIGHKFGANEDWYLAVSRDWPAVVDALTAAQEENERLVHDIERLSASLSAEVTGSERLRESIEALGAMPGGYCFCSRHRIGNDSKIHEPECADLRAALDGLPR